MRLKRQQMDADALRDHARLLRAVVAISDGRLGWVREYAQLARELEWAGREIARLQRSDGSKE